MRSSLGYILHNYDLIKGTFHSIYSMNKYLLRLYQALLWYWRLSSGQIIIPVLRLHLSWGINNKHN